MNAVKTLFYSLFSSVQMSVYLMLLYALVIGMATFIEKYYGTIVAYDVIYRALWFEILNIWLSVLLICCMVQSVIYRRFNIGMLIFHLAFFIALIGAGITRYYGFEGRMVIYNGETSNTMLSRDKYLNVFISDDIESISNEALSKLDIDSMSGHLESLSMPLSPYLRNSIDYTLNAHKKPLTIKSIEINNKSNELSDNLYEAVLEISYGNETRYFNLLNNGQLLGARFGSHLVVLSWDSARIELPFSIKLNKFNIDMYPGSDRPSSYSSSIEVIDKDLESNLDYEIYMNHVLDYKGYRFFQDSYTTDSITLENGETIEEHNGTILSVNKDPGKIPTYIAYSMMILGGIWLLIDRNGRFARLGRALDGLKILSVLSIFLLPFAMPLKAEIKYTNKAMERYGDLEQILSDNSESALKSRMEKLKHIDKSHLEQFARLQIQDFDGRLKPIDTFSMEIMRKITHTTNFDGLKPNNFLVGLLIFPFDMMKIRLIYVDNKELRNLLDVNEGKYVALKDVFDMQKLQSGESFKSAYKIYNLVQDAMQKPPQKQNALDKEVLKLNEKISYMQSRNIWSYLRIFPNKNMTTWLSPVSDDITNVLDIYTEWYMGGENKDIDIDSMLDKSPITPSFAIGVNAISSYLEKELLVGVLKGDFSSLDKVLDSIHSMQEEGSDTLLSSMLVNSEILFNAINIFYILQYVYLLIGLVSLCVILYAIIAIKELKGYIKKAFFISICLAFLVHTISLGARWYIAGHAPWSNAYESMIYIAWASILAYIILRKSMLMLSASSVMAGITLMVANMGAMDPQISNLVPVLQSYWLNIHVSVIVASYGFFGLCMVLGLIALILFIMRSDKRAHLDSVIISLNLLNERSMIIGLVLLTIGTFLGGIWANESWGRYWGWDAKETWSLVTIAIYASILHVRMFVKKHLVYVFCILSVLGFYSVLMTYFGVNYYLAGMHSYAKGDADDIKLIEILPHLLLFIMMAIAWRKRGLDMVRV